MDNKFILFFFCCTFSVKLCAQERVKLDSIMFYFSPDGYHFKVVRECFENEALKSRQATINEKKSLLDKYFRQYSLGNERRAIKLIKKDKDLEKLVGRRVDFLSLARIILIHNINDLGLLCRPRIEGVSIEKISIYSTQPPATHYFYSSELVNNIKLSDIDSINLRSQEKLLYAPSSYYNVEANFIGYLIPYYMKAFELVAVKPAD